MTALVSLETVLLLVLVVLVAGLLRSHAEILRRLGSSADPAPTAQAPTDPAHGVAPPPATLRTPGELRAAPLAGTTPDGDAVTLVLDGPGAVPTLLAFLTSGCSTCAGFWEGLGERRLPPSIRTVVVTHGTERERSARLRSLAPAGVPVVMSSQAWGDYGVPGAPYFVLVDGFVRGEGVATTWQALASLVSDAIEDRLQAQGASSGPARARRVQETLAAAGIGPEHPSLYPGGQAGKGAP